MISKKMRNISMVCLSLVLALTLAFGLSSFSSIKKADAAATPTVSVDFNSWYAADSSGLSSRPTTISFNNDGFFSVATTQTDYVTYTMASEGGYIKYNSTSSTLSDSAVIYGVTTNSGTKTDTQLSFTVSAKSNVKLLVGVDSSNIPSSTYSATLTGNTKGTADQVVVTSSITIAGKTYTPSVSSSKSKLRYFEFDLDKGTTVFTANAALMCGNASTSRKFFIYDVEITPLVTEYTVSFMDGEETISTSKVEEGKTLTSAPTEPTKPAYNFLGWSTDGSTVIDITTVTINSDTTFKAVWEKDASYVKPSITEFDAVSNVEINFGTAKEAIELPTEVTSGEYSLPVTWEWDKDYDATKLQNYTLTGKVTVDADVYDVTAAAPTMQVIVKEIAVASQTLKGTYYTFDNVNVVGLPKTITVSGGNFEISWNVYEANSKTITGSLVAKTGYDVTNATVTANVQYAVATKSTNFINNPVPTTTDGLTVSGSWSYDDGLDGGNRKEGDVAQVFYEGIKTTSGNGTITFFLDKTSNVSFGYGARAMKVVNATGAEVVSWDGTTTPENGAKTTAEYILEPGAYTISATSSSNAFLKFINIINEDTTEIYGVGNKATLPTTAATKKDYTFIGWTANSSSIVTGEQTNANTGVAVYTAVYAKADYLGVSFKTTSASIRYGFILEVVDYNGNSFSLENLGKIAENVTGKFIFTTSVDNEIDVVNYAAKTVTTSQGVKTGIVANLVIENMQAEHYVVATTTSINLTINGVEFTANSGAKVSAQACAEAALKANMFDAATAEIIANNFGLNG